MISPLVQKKLAEFQRSLLLGDGHSNALLYFKPKFDLVAIPDEEKFWQFLKLCFHSPRQTLRNNLKSTHLRDAPVFTDEILNLRAQQMSFEQFLELLYLFHLQYSPFSYNHLNNRGSNNLFFMVAD